MTCDFKSFDFPSASTSRYLESVNTVLEKSLKGVYAFFDVLEDEDHFQEVLHKAAELKEKFSTFVILGTGGSSLGAKTLCDLSTNPFQENVHFLNNVDPLTIHHLVDVLDLEKTVFIAISKSGSTAETLMQTLCLMKVVEEKGLDVKNHFQIITEDKDSPMDRLAKKYAMTSLTHHKKIGGRFSIFSNVGLLPAALSGVDIKILRSSALVAFKNFKETSAVDHPAVQGAISSALHHAEGRNISIMMPYLDRLQSFAAWYCQLWGESLGKEGKGTTPVVALGTVDQHSQLQLYSDGPDDKIYTFLVQDTSKVWLDRNLTPNGYVSMDSKLEYLKDRTMGDLLFAEARATMEALEHKERPVRAIFFAKMAEKELGELLIHFMLETIICAEIIGVDAFDQPGVEKSKVLTRSYLKNLRS